MGIMHSVKWLKNSVVTEKYRVRLSQKGHVLVHVTGWLL